jgi:hypothetical protein
MIATARALRLAVLHQRLVACDSEEDNPGAAEFLHRMAWLRALIADLEWGRARLDA